MLRRGRDKKPTVKLRLFVILYLVLFVIVPLLAAIPPLVREPFGQTWKTITSDEAAAAIKLSVYAATAAAVINALMGTLIAWTLVRVRFPLRKIVDALVDVPFVLPPVVAGLALLAVYGPASWFGQFAGDGGPFGALLTKLHLPVFQLTGGFAGLVIANLFITLPFVVRTTQPVIETLETDVEDAAASLGASTTQIFRLITLPQILPAMLLGFGLAFARGINEYGVAVMVSGNVPFESQIGPVYMYQRLEGNDYTGATAMGAVLTVISLGVLVMTYACIQWRGRRVA